MHGRLIGYDFLKDLLGISALPLERPAKVSTVTKSQKAILQPCVNKLSRS